MLYSAVSIAWPSADYTLTRFANLMMQRGNLAWMSYEQLSIEKFLTHPIEFQYVQKSKTCLYFVHYTIKMHNFRISIFQWRDLK